MSIAAGSFPRQATALALICAFLAGCSPSRAEGSRGAASNDAMASVRQSCDFKPSAATSGASGRLRASDITKLRNGESLSDTTVDHLEISGDDVTVRNVSVRGTISITGSRVLVDHVTTRGVSISGGANVTVQHSNIGFGSGDGIHVTSDRGTMVRNVALAYNYVHDPRVGKDAHYDGIQVRGVDRLSITCSVFDAGPYQKVYNAGIYLEDANGGDSNVTVARNWVYGFGFSIMMDARNVTLESNRVGGDIHWGTCRLGKRTGNPGMRSSGNIDERSGRSLALCHGDEP